MNMADGAELFREDELLPISALQHLVYCPRRAALIYIEGLWDENRLTVEGMLRHQKTHEASAETRGDVHVVRALRLRSLKLGLTGQADVVEFHRVSEDARQSGISIVGLPGLWEPYPVEYKRGKMREEPGYEIQLCAQAICLEEMLGVTITKGALFYGLSQHRTEIVFDQAIRKNTINAVDSLHKLLRSRKTPLAEPDARCPPCSMRDLCLPKSAGRGRSAADYLNRVVTEAVSESS